MGAGGRLNLARPLLLAVMVVGVNCASPPPEPTTTGTVRSAETWDRAVPPIRIRTNHTATLLGTGEILVAGGSSAPKSTELLDPLLGRTTVGPELLEERANHTATMLQTGKVLLAGGNGSAPAGTNTAELYDPLTHTTVATGSMLKARRGHLALRLQSGKVFVVGGGDPTSELYDPTTGTWAAAPSKLVAGATAAATLHDGRVVVTTSGVATNTTEVFDPAGNGGAGTWSFPSSGFPAGFNSRTLTRQFANNLLVSGWVGACGSTGGPPICDTHVSIYNWQSTMAFAGPDFTHGRDAFTAARLPTGDVLFIGGDPTRRNERYNPLTTTALIQDGELTASHVGATSTVLPGGDIVVIGGTQAANDRRVSPGAWRRPNNFLMKKGRKQHAAVRLHDGRILVSGGVGSPDDTTFTGREADVVDLAAIPISVTAVSGMTSARSGHTMTALRSGRVLVAGGGTNTAEIFDPAGLDVAFTAIASMTVARKNHTATLLPSGHVLVAGGDASGMAAELFDPATSTFTALPAMPHAHPQQGAALMPNGLVLIAGGSTVDLFDPMTRTFRSTSPPGALRDGFTARLLGNGKVFLSGGSTLEAEVFDPVTEAWSFVGGQPSRLVEMLWATLPDGRLVTSSGKQPIYGVGTLPLIFDPIASTSGVFATIPTSSHASSEQTITLAGTGEVVAMGGERCPNPACAPMESADVISVYSDAAPSGIRPTLAQVPPKVTAGARVTITGNRFSSGAEASDGTRGSSAVNHPTAVWVSDAGDAVLRSTILDFTNTTATWLVPTTALYGHGQLFVNVAGVMSSGASVEIEPAASAVPCTYDVECATGFCADGVCCNARCDGSCEGCSKARKLGGDDGVCGPVPPGKDIKGRCLLKLGDPCTEKDECGPNFCSQGVCCDSTCEGQCLSCNQAGRAGKCSAINEGACGAACDGDHTLKQLGAPDIDCAPYKCAGPQCTTTCNSARDCVAPAVCSLEGRCVPGTLPSAGDDAVCGCRVVGSRRGSEGALAAFALAATLVWRRRRARGVGAS
jgi:hypothetical protein